MPKLKPAKALVCSGVCVFSGVLSLAGLVASVVEGVNDVAFGVDTGGFVLLDASLTVDAAAVVVPNENVDRGLDVVVVAVVTAPKAPNTGFAVDNPPLKKPPPAPPLGDEVAGETDAFGSVLLTRAAIPCSGLEVVPVPVSVGDPYSLLVSCEGLDASDEDNSLLMTVTPQLWNTRRSVSGRQVRSAKRA